MKKVYFISGLGADKRAFSFLDLSFCEPVFIDWITPLKKEALAGYALRLKEQITEAEPTIVGVSFGGMLATEIGKVTMDAKLILISSNKVKKEFPRVLLTGKYLPLYKWLPPGLIKRSRFIQKELFGPKGKEQKEVFNAIFRDTDYRFTKWAIEAILNWENEEIPAGLIHIHGKADRLLPYKRVNADYAIEKGSHLMIINNAKEISELLKKLIG